MLPFTQTGADLTYLDQCFLVIGLSSRISPNCHLPRKNLHRSMWECSLAMSFVSIQHVFFVLREISVKIYRILEQKFLCFDFVAFAFITFCCASVTSACLSKSPIQDQKMPHFQKKAPRHLKKRHENHQFGDIKTYKLSGFSENCLRKQHDPGSCDWLIFGGRFQNIDAKNRG